MGATYEHTFTHAGTFPYYCLVHLLLGMTGRSPCRSLPSCWTSRSVPTLTFFPTDTLAHKRTFSGFCILHGYSVPFSEDTLQSLNRSHGDYVSPVAGESERQNNACLRSPADRRQRCQEVRTFGTITRELLRFADWLRAAGCTRVAMESTVVY